MSGKQTLKADNRYAPNRQQLLAGFAWRFLPWRGLLRVLMILAGFLTFSLVCSAATSSTPLADPVVEPATLRCLGVYWVVRGDENKNAAVELSYRQVGTQIWQRGPNLFRVEKGRNRDRAIKLAADDWLFAGSVLDVPEATQYDLRLRLADPDGGNVEKIVRTHTIAEPAFPAGGPTYHVVPGLGGGDGSPNNPFKGIKTAGAVAKPGDTFLLHAGTYAGPWTVSQSGEAAKPTLWRGWGDGETVIEMHDTGNKGHLIDVSGRHDVWFERLTVRGECYSDFCLHNASRIVIRRCHIQPVLQGVYGTKNDSGQLGQFFISDNVIEGIQPWPATAEQWRTIPENRGIWIGGRGNVVCYNRVSRCKDGIDTAQYEKAPDAVPAEVAIDFHNNDVSDAYDDGAEMDGSYRNTRAFLNRFVNTLTGISFQPILGGPIYAYRNVLYNTRAEFLKLHNSPSGAVVVHNTFVHHGPVLWVHTPAPVNNCYLRNNLFLGTDGRALDIDPVATSCVFDYDGFGGWSGRCFMAFAPVAGQRVVYKSIEEAHAGNSWERHCVMVDPASAFASGIKPPALASDYDPTAKGPFTTGLIRFDPRTIDLRLNPKSAAAGSGEPLPGFNDGLNGKPVDLGAYAVGTELPHYGPRQEK